MIMDVSKVIGKVLTDMRLYGELHRFLPVLLILKELELQKLVNHRARQLDQQVWIDRTFRVLMDLLTVF